MKMGGRFIFHFPLVNFPLPSLKVNLMRSLLTSALVISLLCASSVAQTTQTSSPKSGKGAAQKPGAEPELSPQQEPAISVLKNLFDRTKEFADDKTRIETQAQIADALWQYDQSTARRQFTEAFRRLSESRMKSDLSHSSTIRKLLCGLGCCD